VDSGNCLDFSCNGVFPGAIRDIFPDSGDRVREQRKADGNHEPTPVPGWLFPASNLAKVSRGISVSTPPASAADPGNHRRFAFRAPPVCPESEQCLFHCSKSEQGGQMIA